VIFEDYSNDFDAFNHIFIQIDGIYVPFFFDKNFNPQSSKIKLEGIDNLEDTLEIAGKKIYQNSSLISPKQESKESLSEYHYLKGFDVLDEDQKLIGQFKDVIEYPMQTMGILANNQLVPITDELIISINKVLKQIIMKIPEGLLDINVSK